MPLEIIVIAVVAAILVGVWIGPKNGWTLAESVLMAAMFSIFGLALLATRKERKPEPPTRG